MGEVHPAKMTVARDGRKRGVSEDEEVADGLGAWKKMSLASR